MTKFKYLVESWNVSEGAGSFVRKLEKQIPIRDKTNYRIAFGYNANNGVGKIK